MFFIFGLIVVMNFTNLTIDPVINASLLFEWHLHEKKKNIIAPNSMAIKFKNLNVLWFHLKVFFCHNISK
jgi:hypothetical protein